MSIKKAISVILCFVLLAATLIPAVSAEQNKIAYQIVNPYEGVDWENVDTYKACLHAHTTASDGDVPLNEWLQLYYEADFDILAITDHGVITNGWKNPVQTNGIFNGFREVEPLSEEEYNRITTGADRNGRGMIDITGGIECNMAVVSKTHVNGYWTTYGQGVWGKENDYETAPREIEKSGGYSVLNHVGDWVNSNNFPERATDPFYVNYFTDIFTKYKTCLGMEIINSTDWCTRADRILWDEILQQVIPQGRNVWGFADDDSEAPGDINRSFELFPLSENTEENVKNAMINGSFFAASRFCGGMKEKYDFIGDGLVPVVTKITIDGNVITVECDKDRGCETIEWIADGKIIKSENNDSCTYSIDLGDYQDKLSCYIRFALKSPEHGVTYSQAFELKYEGRVTKERSESAIPDNFIGKLFWAWYQRVGVVLIDLISEKILDKIGYIPKFEG